MSSTNDVVAVGPVELTGEQQEWLDGLREFLACCEAHPELIPGSGTTIAKGLYSWNLADGESPGVRVGADELGGDR